MRAYQLPKGGAGIDALVQVERPDPKPAYRQVVVKVKACSLNFRDLGIVRGTYRMPVRENLIPLSDGAGEVIEIGPGATRVKVGDRVAGCFLPALGRWRGACRRPRKCAWRRHRRHACGICGVGGGRGRKNSGALVAGGSRPSPVRASPFGMR